MKNWNIAYQGGEQIITHKTEDGVSIIHHNGSYFLVHPGHYFEEPIGFSYEDISRICAIADDLLLSIEDEEDELKASVLELSRELENCEVGYEFEEVIKKIISHYEENGSLPPLSSLGVVDNNGTLVETFRYDILYGGELSAKLFRFIKRFYQSVETEVDFFKDNVTIVEPIINFSSVPGMVLEESEFRNYVGHVIMTASQDTDVWIYVMNSDYGDYAVVVDYVAGTDVSFRVTQEIVDTIIEFYGIDISPLLLSPVSVFESSQRNTDATVDEKDVEDIIEEVDADIEKEIAVIEEQIEKIESLPEDIRENDKIMEIYYLLLGKREYIQKQHDDKKSQEIVDNIIDEISEEIGELDKMFLDDDRNEIMVEEGRTFNYGSLSIKPIFSGLRGKVSRNLIVENEGKKQRIEIGDRNHQDVLREIIRVNESVETPNLADAYVILQAIEEDKDSINSFYNSLVNIAYKLDGYSSVSDYKKFIKNVVDDGNYEDKSDTLPYLINVASMDAKKFNSVVNRMKLRLGLD